ncbi:hypothetical protein MNBD_GAMMA26-165 [hydrothermal vent metagenome]|uniref:DUF3108 domain-containing protein n=1 Tax=hydrothermal vent metagenome TaxID=652676 RepID=A0A3B1BVJ3_9ZZZZ
MSFIQLSFSNARQYPLRHKCSRFLVWALSPLLFVSSALAATERLEYRISYQGSLTAMAKLDICDAVLETSRDESTISGKPVFQASVNISSKRYKKMEAVYPFRYLLRSFFSPDMQRSILFERSKKTRKLRHEIVWFNWDKGVTERFKKRKQKEIVKSQARLTTRKQDGVPGFFGDLNYNSNEFRRSSKPGLKLADGMLDRLSLLQSVRSQQLSPGQDIRLSISDGKKILNYLVQVQKRETIEHQGQLLDTYKLRFDAFAGGRWSGTPSHPGVFAWLTADDKKTPVRFTVNYAGGEFLIQVKNL